MSQPYELLVRFNRDGSVSGASVKTIETVGGRDYESDPIPLSDTDEPAFAEFAEQFAAAVVAERDAAIAQLALLQAEIDRLNALIPPPLPERSIYPRELLGRLTMAEVVAAIRSDDDAVIYAVANLQTTVSPVLLDSEETQMLIGSLVMAGILTAERMAEVLA